MLEPQRSVPGWLARTLDRLIPSPRLPSPLRGGVGAGSAFDTKASRTGPLLAFEALRQPVWSPRDYAAFAREGFAQNAIVYRSVRMVAEAAASVPLLLYEGDQEITEHPLLDLIARPNPICSAPDLLESWYGFLLVSGNAYLEAVALGGQLRELHALRPDRMKVIPGPDGWPEAFEYSAGGRSVRFAGEVVPGVRPILHTKLFNPVNDHYGLSPIEAAATAIDIHNTASRWNKALLDNSARPSGALVYQDVEPMIRGSAVTGESFRTGEPFDVGRRSDYDISLVSPTLMQRAADLGIPLRGGGTRTGPLGESALRELGLRELAGNLRDQADRPVSFMIYSSRHAVTRRGPSRPILGK
jgi:hypothetical protein